MIVLHHLNKSRSQRIIWLLEELGLTGEENPANLSGGEARRVPKRAASFSAQCNTSPSPGWPRP